MAESPNPPVAVRLAELQGAVNHNTAILAELTQTVKGIAAQQIAANGTRAASEAGLKQHFDLRFEALRNAVFDVARAQAAFEQWQKDHGEQHRQHEEQHKQEATAHNRKMWSVDVIGSLIAALIGVFVRGGGTP